MIYGKTLRITNETFETRKQNYLDFRKHFDTVCNGLGNDLEKWGKFSDEVFEKYGLKFNISLYNNDEEIMIEEEGYVEPTPDPMIAYSEDITTYSNIKATHELGLISDEELAESQDYMRSIYPSEVATFRLNQKPEWFDKFRNRG